jgi:galactonate dehydratase
MAQPDKTLNRRHFLGAAIGAAAGSAMGLGSGKSAAVIPDMKTPRKITDLKVMRMSVSPTAKNNWLFVKIETDSGIYGLGEGSLQFKDDALEAELLAFKRFLIGKDPFRTDWIWTSLYRRVTWTGGAVTTSAISAIDLALCDIKGKALGVPVYELFGGAVHEKVPIYANGWRDGSGGTPEGLARKAKEVKAAGYTALKFYPFGGPQVVTQERIDKGIAQVAAVREAVGPHMEIGIDIRARLNIWSARRVAQRLEPYDIAWMEEPIIYDNPETMAEFAKSVRVPVATGEQLFTRWQFRELLEHNALGILQPDICHAGGISELKKIATMAETYYVMIAPHNSNGPISTIASLHLDMCIHNSFMQELLIKYLPRYNEVLTQPIVVEEGSCTPPAGPGWGVDLRDDVLAKYPPVNFTPVESEPYREF